MGRLTPKARQHFLFEVPALGKILLYLIAVVLLGALLAPPSYWLLHQILDFPFYRYFSRVTQITAFILLIPLLLWLGIRSTGEFGLRRNPHAVRDVLAGWFLALLPAALLAAACLLLDVYRIRQEPNPLVLLRIATTAGIVAVVEEFLFRGILLGLTAKSLGRWPAALGVSLIFASVHFLRPSKQVDLEVEWWTGLAQIPRVFDAAPPLLLAVAGFVSLFAAGMILAFAAFRTRSLWLPIGLHGGWIFCQQGLQWLAKYRVEPPESLFPWIGPNVVSGAVPTGFLPLMVLLLTAAGVWFYLRYALAVSRSS